MSQKTAKILQAGFFFVSFHTLEPISQGELEQKPQLEL